MAPGPTGYGLIRPNAAYAAAKTGLAVLAKSLAVEGAGRGVGCVLACPGLVDTEYLGEGREVGAPFPSSRRAARIAGRDRDPRALSLLAAETLYCVGGRDILRRRPKFLIDSVMPPRGRYFVWAFWTLFSLDLTTH